MTVLADLDIVYENGSGMSIEPFNPGQVQPASYDVTLGNKFKVFKNFKIKRAQAFEVGESNIENWMEDTLVVERGNVFRLEPLSFALGHTVEYFKFSDRLAGRLEGKSSLGRLGLCIHATAGWFDPGFEGTATIEMFNMSSNILLLHPGILIGQMSFLRMSSPVKLPYGSEALGSKYQGQVDPEASRYTPFPGKKG